MAGRVKHTASEPSGTLQPDRGTKKANTTPETGIKNSRRPLSPRFKLESLRHARFEKVSNQRETERILTELDYANEHEEIIQEELLHTDSGPGSPQAYGFAPPAVSRQRLLEDLAEKSFATGTWTEHRNSLYYIRESFKDSSGKNTDYELYQIPCKESHWIPKALYEDPEITLRRISYASSRRKAGIQFATIITLAVVAGSIPELHQSLSVPALWNLALWSALLGAGMISASLLPATRWFMELALKERFPNKPFDEISPGSGDPSPRVQLQRQHPIRQQLAEDLKTATNPIHTKDPYLKTHDYLRIQPRADLPEPRPRPMRPMGPMKGAKTYSENNRPDTPDNPDTPDTLDTPSTRGERDRSGWSITVYQHPEHIPYREQNPTNHVTYKKDLRKRTIQTPVVVVTHYADITNRITDYETNDPREKVPKFDPQDMGSKLLERHLYQRLFEILRENTAVTFPKTTLGNRLAQKKPPFRIIEHYEGVSAHCWHFPGDCRAESFFAIKLSDYRFPTPSSPGSPGSLGSLGSHASAQQKLPYTTNSGQPATVTSRNNPVVRARVPIGRSTVEMMLGGEL